MQELSDLNLIIPQYDLFLVDQWGVLHNGSTPYPGAIAAIETLKNQNKKVTVLTNSGKRGQSNSLRLAKMGFSPDCFHDVLSSGELLWRWIKAKRPLPNKPLKSVFIISRDSSDHTEWLSGLDCKNEPLSKGVDACLLLGIPDHIQADHYDDLLMQALEKETLMICANPDINSPRETGLVVSPGQIASRYQSLGGKVIMVGKPQPEIYQETFDTVDPKRVLMIGDSLHHDIAGAATSGIDSLLITGGIHENDFSPSNVLIDIKNYCQSHQLAKPTYVQRFLSLGD